MTPLHFAAKGGHEELTKWLLLEENVPIDPRDIFGYTPLHFAVCKGHLEIVEILLEKKAWPYFKNSRGLIPLEYAEETKNVKITALLKRPYPNS
jgi:ankyrin repeat protein